MASLINDGNFSDDGCAGQLYTMDKVATAPDMKTILLYPKFQIFINSFWSDREAAGKTSEESLLNELNSDELSELLCQFKSDSDEWSE